MTTTSTTYARTTSTPARRIRVRSAVLRPEAAR